MSTAEDFRGTRDPACPAPALRAGRGWLRQYAFALRVIDVAIILVAVGMAQWLRFDEVPAMSNLFDRSYTAVSAVVAAIWAAFLGIYRARAQKILGAGPDEYRRVAAATISAFGTIAIVAMLGRIDIARGYLAIALPLGLLGLLIGRRGVRWLVAKRRRDGLCLTSVLVVGQPDAARTLAHSLTRTPEHGYRVVGLCFPGEDSLATESYFDGVPVFAYDDDLAESIINSGADTVALTGTERLGSRGIGDLSWQLEKLDIDLLVSPGLVGLAGPRLTMRPVADLPLIHLDKPQYDGAKRFQKRLFDLCFSTLVLIPAMPVILAAAAIVKLTSKGPAFYESERIGLDGESFKMIKIRTMVDGADQIREELAQFNEVAGGGIFKMRRDPRVTPVGRFLRRYSIDELPQFINVLRGQMSVVGPRPLLPSEVAAYDHRERRRLLVRPGITGLWQISGRSKLTWDDCVRLDLSYVENWSMMTDLSIAVKTIRPVLTGYGAY